jgi:flagella basal body P-ring formation protein FlgA
VSLWLFFTGLAPAFAQTAPETERARAAVLSAIQERLGPDVQIDLDRFSSRLASATTETLAATPDLTARTGRSVRFALLTGPRGRAVRVGEATAIVRVSGPHVTARRLLAAGRVLTADDVELSSGPIDGAPLRRLATRDQALGARVLHALAVGDPIVSGAIAGVPVVRAGDRVVATVRSLGVEVSVLAVAEQNGMQDQIIRVVNPDSRRAVRARVVAKGEVEVLSGR